MSAIWVRRFVDLLLAIVVLAAIGALWQAGSSIAEGKFHMVSYPAKSENITMYTLGQSETYWQVQEGTVRIDNHTWLRVMQLGKRLVELALIFAVFWQLRGMLERFGRGNVFADANIFALRRIGLLLLLGCLLSVAMAVFTQAIILDTIPADPLREIRSSFSTSTRGIETIRMQYTLPILPLLMAMIAFITAGAFKSGQQYREDSESVV